MDQDQLPPKTQHTVIFPKSFSQLTESRPGSTHNLHELHVFTIEAKHIPEMYQRIFDLMQQCWPSKQLKDVAAYYSADITPGELVPALLNRSGCLRIV